MKGNQANRRFSTHALTHGRLKARSEGSADWRNGYCVFWKGSVQNVFNGVQSMFKRQESTDMINVHFWLTGGSLSYQ